mgnify:CR=1 FL=1
MADSPGTDNPWKEGDTARALEIWAEYQRTHDVSRHEGQAVGIDPASGRVWFGEDMLDIERQMRDAGQFAIFFCLTVGCDYYLRKGARR